MTDQVSTHTPSTVIVRSLLRVVGTIAVLTTIYFLLPLDHSALWAAVTILVIGLAALAALVIFQVRSVMSSSYPLLRGIESPRHQRAAVLAAVRRHLPSHGSE